MTVKIAFIVNYRGLTHISKVKFLLDQQKSMLNWMKNSIIFSYFCQQSFTILFNSIIKQVSRSKWQILSPMNFDAVLIQWILNDDLLEIYYLYISPSWRDCGSGRVDHWWHLSCWCCFGKNFVSVLPGKTVIWNDDNLKSVLCKVK